MPQYLRLLRGDTIQAPLAHTCCLGRTHLAFGLVKTDIKSCEVTGPARTKAPDAEATAQGPSGNKAASLKGVAEVEPAELFAFKECQDLFRTRLTEPLLRLIPQLTGLRLHVLWHRPMDFQGLGAMPVLCPMARQRAGANRRQRKCCEFCLQRCWKLPLSPANQGRRFIGRCGITNFCARLQVDKVCPLTLVLQARITQHATRNTQHTTSPAAFRDAVALARLILHDLKAFWFLEKPVQPGVM